MKTFILDPLKRLVYLPPGEIFSPRLREEVPRLNFTNPEVLIGSQKFLVFSEEISGLFRFIGLYPYSLIENAILTQKLNLAWFFLLNFVLSFSLARFLGRKFLEPVLLLTLASNAIERRDFSHQIPPLEPDELGNLGAIFNQVIVGLDELQVAREFQESFFPGRPLYHGGLKVFGRCFPMREVGGDYFDYFPVGDKKVAIIVGDVSGHGVPSALMMAIAKTCILESQEVWDNPVAVMEVLYKYFYEFRAQSERASMTLLFMLADSERSSITFCSAGHWGPYRVSSSSAEEIPLSSGPAIGVRAKVKISATVVPFFPGAAIVLFTDGLPEVANPHGEKLWETGFSELLTASFSENPETLVAGIHQRFLAFRDSPEPQDDLTIIALVAARENVGPNGGNNEKLSEIISQLATVSNLQSSGIKK